MMASPTSPVASIFRSPSQVAAEDQSFYVHLWAVTLGLITGVLSSVYSLILHAGLHVVWGILPAALLEKGILDTASAPLYILGVCCTGGLAVACLGAIMPAPGNVDEWMNKLHKDGSFPFESMVPQLVLSFFTALCGFSIGPEAPMVIAGAVIGSYFAQKNELSQPIARIFNISGATGALSGFFSLPLCGALFALELPQPFSIEYHEAISPAVCASVTAVLVNKALTFGTFHGKFDYGEVQPQLPPQFILLPLAVGLVGGGVAVLAIMLIHQFKVGAAASKAKLSNLAGRPWVGPFLFRILIGILVGIISCFYPQTMFWGELNLNSITDAHNSAKPIKPLGDSPIVDWAIVDTRAPMGCLDCFQIGCVKIITIALATCGAYPGGIIFPFFFVGAAFGQSMACLGGFFDGHLTIITMLMMASVQATITGTPLATVLVLGVSAASYKLPGGDGEVQKQMSGVIIPLVAVAVYASSLVPHVTGVKYFASSRSRAKATMQDSLLQN